MPAESLKQRLLNSSLDGDSKEDLYILFNQLLSGLQAVMAKLDAEAGGGVATFDTNYAATFAGYVTN